MKFYIKTHARSRNAVIDKLEDQVLLALEHLAYLYVFPDVQDTNHWRSEVWTLLSKMPKVRIGMKVRYLTPQEFLNYTYHQHDSINKFRYVLEAAVELKPKYNPDYERVYRVLDFKHICDNYFNWLSIEICKEGFIYPADCYKKLEELGL